MREKEREKEINGQCVCRAERGEEGQEGRIINCPYPTAWKVTSFCELKRETEVL